MKTRSILALAVIALCTATTANAKYSGGTGTPEAPYRIATAEDLNDIGNHEEDFDKDFILVNDVNLAAYTGTQFKIIGNSTTKFTGVFDGNDNKVWSFTYTSNGIHRVGLFGYVGTSGQIKNLGMENVDVNDVNGNYVGGLVGINQGTITNCYCTGSVRGDQDVGGLVGINQDDGTITNCYSTGGATGEDYVGGLVGYNYKEGTITNCYSTGGATGEDYVGGLVGWNFPLGMITDCYSTGSVTGNGYYVGGLVGVNDGTITNCYSTGSVTGTGEYVGGLVGENSGTITNCYSTGSVPGSSYIGGLVGYNFEAEVVNSFWDIETSGQTTSAGGTGKTTAEMKTKSTFTDAGWDFVNIWDICEGTNYPKLIWQIPIADFACPDGVNFIDYAVLASAWQTEPNDAGWNAVCDISDPNDNIINELDLDVFCENWLEGTGP